MKKKKYLFFIQISTFSFLIGTQAESSLYPDEANIATIFQTISFSHGSRVRVKDGLNVCASFGTVTS